MADADIRLELYKQLREEMRSYSEKGASLWLQKFILLGASVGFLVQNYNKFDGLGDLPILSLAIISLPCVAALIDAKALEYALHARLVSGYIVQNFTDDDVAIGWERAVWGAHRDEKLAIFTKYRTWTTLMATMFPTLLLFVLSSAALGKTSYWLATGGVAVLYVVLFFWVWSHLFTEHSLGTRTMTPDKQETAGPGRSQSGPRG